MHKRSQSEILGFEPVPEALLALHRDGFVPDLDVGQGPAPIGVFVAIAVVGAGDAEFFGDLGSDAGLAQDGGAEAGGEGKLRSEEHTSELQSLMRISYAVICLKTKTQYMTNRQQR